MLCVNRLRVICLLSLLYVVCAQQAYGQQRIDDTTAIMQLINKGEKIRTDFPDSAIQIFENTLHKSEALEFTKGVDISLSSLASLYKAAGAYDKASHMLEQKIVIYSQSQSLRKILGTVYDYLGLISYVKSDNEQAAKYYYQAILIMEQSPTEERQWAGAYHNFAIVLIDLGQNKQALYYLNKAEKIAVPNKNYRLQAQIHSTKGNMFFFQNNFKESLFHFEAS